MRNSKIFESPQRVRRKLAALGVTCLAVAGVGAALLGSASAATTLTVNDDTTGPGPAGATCGTPDHGTIQAAINDPAATAGTTILVCAGTYTENVFIDEDLTINGAQAGVDARGRGASESTIQPALPGRVVELRAGSAGATLDGFTVMGGTRGIESISGPLNGLSLLNNRIVGFTNAGIFLNDSGINVTLDQNVVDASSKVGGGGVVHLDTDAFHGFRMTNSNIVNGATGTGFFVDGNHNVDTTGGARAPMLDGNLIDGNGTGANLGSRAFGHGSITNNTFSDSGFDGLQGGIQNSLIDGNDFTNNVRSGLALTSFGNTGVDRGAQNTDITNNDFTGNDREGIFFSSTQAAGTISTNVANQNNLVGNTIGATYAGNPANAPETIDVTCNWWGDPSGPNHPDNAGGAGDSVVDGPTGSLNYTPWLTAPAPGGPCNGPLPQQMERKEAVRDSLAALLPTGNKKDDHEINEAIKHINKSLDPDLWVDENHLDPKHGHKVFDEERNAVKHLEKVVPPPDVTAQMDEIVDIDHDLAETAISEIPPAMNPDRQDKVDEETAKANEELAEGDAEAASGDRDKAIEHYKKAWEHAQHATKEANKP